MFVSTNPTTQFPQHHHQHHNAISAADRSMKMAIMNESTSVLVFFCKVAIVCVVFWNHFLQVRAFTTLSSTSILVQGTSTRTAFCPHQFHTCLTAATSGRGMGSTTKTNKKGGSNKSKSKASNTTASSSSSSPFDVSSSLIRLAKKYDELMLNAAKQLQSENEVDDEEVSTSDSPKTTPIMVSEYVIAARASSKRYITDWVPIAQMCLKRPESEYQDGASDVMVQAAISAYCRELSHVAAMGAPVFSKIARNELQYSVESVDSFHKHVYDEVVAGKANQNEEETMTKAVARKTLGFYVVNGSATEITKADIKQAYRKLSFELHPDRFQGTPEECDEATRQFSQVKLAYETLSSGVRDQHGVSWYESLGGRARTGFVGPVNLLPLTAAQEHMKRHDAEGAIVGLDPTMVQSFVARHLRSE